MQCQNGNLLLHGAPQIRIDTLDTYRMLINSWQYYSNSQNIYNIWYKSHAKIPNGVLFFLRWGLSFVVKHLVKCRLQMFELYRITPIAVWLLLGNGIVNVVSSVESHEGYISSDQLCSLCRLFVTEQEVLCQQTMPGNFFFHVMWIVNTTVAYRMRYGRNKGIRLQSY